jgi:hypothetical protein
LLSAAEWKEEASTIYSEFNGIIIDSGMRMFEKTDTLTTIAGTGVYQVPSDFLSMVGVDYLQSDGQRIELEPMLAQERNYFTGTNSSAWAVAYELIGQNITLWPQPPAGQTYHVVYVPQPADISDAPDVKIIDVITPAGEAYFTWSLALVGGIKEESEMVPFYERKVKQYADHVKTWATQRELYTPKRRFTHGDMNTSAAHGNGGGFLPGDYIRG